MPKQWKNDTERMLKGSRILIKSERWNEKGMQTNNVIRRENGFEQYCKSFPKSVQNTPKLVPATVLEASWGHLGHHRAFYSKTLAGNSSFWGGLWVAFGALGYSKAPATLSHVTFWATFLDQKLEKRHPKRRFKIYTGNT